MHDAIPTPLLSPTFQASCWPPWSLRLRRIGGRCNSFFRLHSQLWPPPTGNAGIAPCGQAATLSVRGVSCSCAGDAQDVATVGATIPVGPSFVSTCIHEHDCSRCRTPPPAGKAGSAAQIAPPATSHDLKSGRAFPSYFTPCLSPRGDAPVDRDDAMVFFTTIV